MPDLEQRVINTLIGIDETVNAALGGEPDETISGTVGRHAKEGDPLAQEFEQPLINLIMHNPQHCQEVAAAEEAKRKALHEDDRG